MSSIGLRLDLSCSKEFIESEYIIHFDLKPSRFSMIFKSKVILLFRSNFFPLLKTSIVFFTPLDRFYYSLESRP